MSKKIKVAIITNIIPAYREGFYDRLFRSEEISATVFCQKSVPGSGYKMNEEKYKHNLYLFKYWSLGNAKLVWQFLPYTKLLREFDVLVVDGNIRHISQSLFSLIAKLTGKKVVIWSSVNHPGKSKLEWIRLKWWRAFQYFLTYTEDDIKDLKAAGFENKSFVSINNGLDQKALNEVVKKWDAAKIKKWKVEKGLQNKQVIISSGRLKDNKYYLGTKAFPELKKGFPNLFWVVVGDGSDLETMKSEVEKMQLSESVTFLGAVYDDEELAPWFLSADIFVHPCAVGLSIMHAFGYGLPIVTHDDVIMHGPEFTIFQNNETGLSYEKGNMQDYIASVSKLLSDKAMQFQMQQNTRKVVNQFYNVDVMLEKFTEMMKRVTMNYDAKHVMHQ